MSNLSPIPAVLRVDVEPDEHFPIAKDVWNGFLDMVSTLDVLRHELYEVNGFKMHPTWFVRMDPDIGRVFGEIDFAVRQHQESFDYLRNKGDQLGLHVHAHRWDHENEVLFSDYADEEWVKQCIEISVETFKDCFGESVKRISQGGYFLTDAILDICESVGIEVDLTAEPGLKPRTHDPSFGEFATAPTPNYANCPQHPYYPSKSSFLVPASTILERRSVLMVPLTSRPYLDAQKSMPRKIVSRILNRPRPHYPLSMWKKWPSPKHYWDLVLSAANEQADPYLAFALRTDAVDSETYRRARDLLSYLPTHPIAKRIHFVDPLSPNIKKLGFFKNESNEP